MHDQDLRKFALDIASTSLRGAPFTEIVKGAEAFYEFLAGETVIRKSEALSYIKDVVSDLPPPIPTQDHGDADQSPKCLAGFVGANGHVYGISGDGRTHDLIVPSYSDDDTPTRIVRPHMTEVGT